MNIRLYFFIGFVLTELGIIICRGDYGCSNEPVTPYPTRKPSIERPNTPILPKPRKTTAPSAILSPTLTSDCANQPLSEKKSVGPTSIMQINPVPNNTCCSAMPTMPHLNHCCFQLCCRSCDCSSTGIQSIVTPATLLPKTAQPSSEALVKCPPGTVLFGRRCHLLYCPRGSKMLNDRCIVIECPKATVWTGHACSIPEPIVQSLKLNNNIVAEFNQTKPLITLNNKSNIFVNASLHLHLGTEYKEECDSNKCEEATMGVEINTAPTLKCCEVMTPRICELRNNRWRCYSRRSRRCGDFCIAHIIYLRPPRIQATPQYLVLPPIRNVCQSYDNCGPMMGRYDCSGCAFNRMERCSYYCYHYACPSRKCDFYDQEKYCADKIDSYGCHEDDGCVENWCL